MAPARSPEQRSRIRLVLVALVTAAAVALPAFSIGRLSVILASGPSTTSAEAGYARDMQTHHDQGVEMAMIVRDRTDDEAVRLLAYDIATTQAHQSGQLYGWLTQWGLPQAGSEPPMAWMDEGGAHEHDGAAPMPGMATPEELEQLRAAAGVDAERLFLRLMIDHHVGAVEMSEAVLARTDDPTVQSFARAVVASQQSETALMEDMLAERP
ncbi:DUF305 domain-containing protein [Naasia sp. SYSU D00948]|uniref:DUF305 domain-containing protein n=1 Tax=Naasia sp. SYSU D00948 TaxID=2817379 RepID=UPI001B3056EA|nr:DUF305 domain-containing protein [Naasia sp. SYSU D00948]